MQIQIARVYNIRSGKRQCSVHRITVFTLACLSLHQTCILVSLIINKSFLQKFCYFPKFLRKGFASDILRKLFRCRYSPPHPITINTVSQLTKGPSYPNLTLHASSFWGNFLNLKLATNGHSSKPRYEPHLFLY